MKKLGTVIKVKKGVRILDLNIDQSGWCGRITDRGIDQMIGVYYEVEWDTKEDAKDQALPIQQKRQDKKNHSTMK